MPLAAQWAAKMITRERPSQYLLDYPELACPVDYSWLPSHCNGPCLFNFVVDGVIHRQGIRLLGCHGARRTHALFQLALQQTCWDPDHSTPIIPGRMQYAVLAGSHHVPAQLSLAQTPAQLQGQAVDPS